MSNDDEHWIKDLEKALVEGQELSPISNESDDLNALTNDCHGQTWRELLTFEDDTIQTLFDERPVIRNVEQLKEDSQKLIASLEIEDEEEKLSLLSDTEVILITTCKIQNLDIYDSSNRWPSLLRPIISLKLPRIDVYSMFRAIGREYIAKHKDCYHLLRILLLYHDPELCNLLDSLKLGPELYSEIWVQTLFAEMCSLDVILTIWDLYFAKKDKFFIFFLALVFIINARDYVFSLKHQPKLELIQLLKNLPSQLSIEDIHDFWTLAEYYDNKTPSSFKKLLENPTSFWTAVEGLLSCQKQSFVEGCSSGSEHWCFAGGGSSLDGNQNTHMVVSAFLQKHSLYVSMLIGGYQALHDYFEQNNIDGLSDHDRKRCEQCLAFSNLAKERTSQTNVTNELFSKLSVVMKSKSVEVKGKFLDFLSSNSASVKNEKSTNEKSKMYRNMAPVFSIDEEDNHQDSDDDLDDINSSNNLSLLLNKSNIMASFDCHNIKNEGKLVPGKLLLTDNHMIIVEVDEKDSNKIKSVVNRSLGTIMNIKCRKKRPDLIIFEYGDPNQDSDRFLIPHSQKATNFITKQILDFLERNDN
ncbi:TBC1 domain family member 23 isoform X4 [Daktulosphaira vitifoliae]|uniref:TBC1 domain family member 23 isoform X4 n=1 Tax=Daktulosphaira vitifoliae TaxID=58002 RepID=UPI0021A9D2CA|nr:TBC1 domain family member 23 isoform X4 [Daktulosphaira vitifoliae]